MERWNVFTNNVYYTASIVKQEGPWWLFALDDISNIACDWLNKLPDISIPPIIRHISVTKDSILGMDYLEDDEVRTIEYLYGTIQEMWHAKICDPILQWSFRKHKHSEVRIDLEEIPREWAPWAFKNEDKDKDENETRFKGQTALNYDKYLKARDDEIKAAKIRKSLETTVISSITKDSID